MGKFSSKPNIPAAPAIDLSEKDTTEEDNAANRLRIAEKRRKGRRASILSNISKDDIRSTSLGRPSAGSNTLFGS